MDASDFGRYGTLYLLKRHEPDAIVAPYPIDEPEITLGRDTSCSIRLYYAEVSAVHCKVVFNDEGKAFVVVFGTNGLLIDDCPVYPSPAGNAPATVPLPNNSILEVQKKRFRFAYPPKHLRTTLAAIPPTPITTPGTRRRALRMSMITSAKVFSPRPFEDPRRNLEILQSPLKTVFKPEPESDDEDAEHEDDEEGRQNDETEAPEDIILVESDHPRVMESEKDLVILDHVTVTDPPPSAAPSPYRASSYASPARQPRAVQMPVPPQNWAPPRTPARRMPRASLHRAVLIRSAQRAALKHEMQREEELDAEEVESIMGDDEGEGGVRGMEDVVEEYEEGEVQVKEEDEQQRRRTPMSGWRKSLEAVKGGLGWAFRAASVEAETGPAEDIPQEEPQPAGDVRDDTHDEDMSDEQLEDPYPNYDQENANDEEQDYMTTEDMEISENIYPNIQEELEQAKAGPSTPEPSAAPVRPLGRFMTPQASSTFSRPAAQGRYSIGGPAPNNLSSSVSGTGAGPRRVRLIEPWKVSDIVVPTTQEEVKKEEENVKEEREQSVAPGSALTGTPRRDRVTEEEKRAIRERRKSALTTPDNFFNGQAPGFRRASTAASAPLPALFPTAQSTSPKKDPGATLKTEDGATAGAEEDASVLLARMRQMVEGVRRRQSMEVGAGESPRRKSLSPRKRNGFSLLAPELGAQRQGEDAIMEEQEEVGEGVGYGEQADDDFLPVSTAPRQAGTPRMNDLRHLFAAPGPSATPQLTGVREMFHREKRAAGVPDDALEGVGEMMTTPVGWRPRTVDQAEGDVQEDDDIHEEELAPAVPSRTAKGKGVASRRTPRSAATQKPTPASNLATVAEDDAATSAEARPNAARVVRRTRTRTVESDQESTGTSIPRAARSGHARTEEEDEVPELPTRTKSAARKKAGTATDASEDEAGPGSSKPVRRSTRAASAEPEAARKTPASTAASARRTRVTRTPVPEEPVVTAPKASTTRRGARGKAAKTAVAVSDNDEDPLDSLTPGEAPPAAAKVRRTGRSRIPAGAVKEEDDSPAVLPASDDDSAAPPARTARGRKVAGTSKAAASSGANKSATRSRAGTSTKKAAPEVPSSGKSTPTTGEEEDGHAGDKENTPEPQTEDDVPAVAPATKTKGKSAPASGSKAKVPRSVAKTGRGTEGPAGPIADGAVKTRVSRKRVTTASKS
ncbi:uncharacterized protein B0H18DRAFT_1101746 [Fomitopsis serialis]|uniref:uncharacterized protein n=1 Tax=Fomitopsis serialis TaxID=139415 RepID=UPI002007F2D3|nr:uncharacterized protein B0H18DRAFT_1101746 [Neoantrodia serialis]KAH9934220.1 hypothetical protein B0H18DRAFT_1101746 [Neoantrodia serialis]